MDKKRGIIQEFKEFITRGNVVDLAVGVIVGSAFTAIVNSFVNDVIMPFIGMIIGGMNFSDLKLVLSPAIGDVPEAAIYYGRFIQNIINFLMIAAVVFMMVKLINKLRRKKDEPKPEPPKTPEDILLLREIRDALNK